MRRRILAAGLALLLAAGAQPALGQADTLTLATLNCEFLTRPRVHVKFGLPFDLSDAPQAARQQWEQPGFRDARFAEAAQAVAQVLATLDADVLALTEVGDDADVVELQQALNALGAVYPHRAVGNSRDTFTRQNVAVLSRFPLTNLIAEIPGRESFIEEVDDPETEDDTGISKGMRVTVQAHGRAVLLYVVHLASERGGHEQDQQRIAQASILRRHYLPALRADSLVVVAGDLNDHPGQPTLLRLRGLDDIDADLIQTGHARYFDDDALDTRFTYVFQGIRRQIDHLLLAPAFGEATLRGGIQTRTVDHGNALATDHRALVVLLRLRRP